jgi:hypothetical protein
MIARPAATPSLPEPEQRDGETMQEEAYTNTQSGAISFSELVRAHYEWEKEDCHDGAADARYRAKLTSFQESEGALIHAYWATRRPSAVGLTVKEGGWFVSLLNDHDAKIRLHRVTDWLAPEAKLAELLHHCDTLAIKVSEVLRGTPERIAKQWLFAVESHLLGFIERTRGKAEAEEITATYNSQADELIQIERYYASAGEKAARIVYFWGMIVGVAFAATVGFALAGVLWRTGWFNQPQRLRTETFFVCFIAGGIGAVVSVLMRMSSNKFQVDYEVGRSTIRRLGSFRPFIGAVFGMALYFLFRSGISQVSVPSAPPKTVFFFGILAFLAGFNERWTNVLFGKAELTIAGSLGGSTSGQAPSSTDAEDDCGGR